MKKKIVSWRKTFTTRKGTSSLSLASQTVIIDHFVKIEKGELIADFYEEYKGKELSGCTELSKAILYCKEQGATLIIAHSACFCNVIDALHIYNETQGNIYFCNLPETDKFMLTLSFNFVERDALLVSIITKKLWLRKRLKALSWVTPKVLT